MPKGPQGQKRPADVIGAAVLVGKIATGEEEDAETNKPDAEKVGSKGGNKRAANLSAKRRSEIAKKAAQKRWQTK